MIKFLDLHKQYLNIKDEIDNAIKAVIEKSSFISGDFVSIFVNEFAKYLNIDYCIGVGNGTDALEIAIESLDLPKGSEILVPANTFIATSEAVTRSGHKVVFCDCKQDDHTISPQDIREKITKKTRAIIPVHLYGCPCDMDEILDIAKNDNLKIIEDCAQAHGAEFNRKKVGTFGDIATFSFFPGKLLGAYGDGGAIVTNDKELSDKCKKIANHGRLHKFDHTMEGRNSRLDGLQAAILSVKLTYLDEWVNKRNEIAGVYDEKLHNIADITKVDIRKKHAYHLYVIRVPNRNTLIEKFKENNISYGIHYPDILPKLEAYKYLKQYNDCKQANNFSKLIISLPIHEYMREKEIKKVINTIKKSR